MFNDYISLDDFDKGNAVLVLNADSPLEALNQASALEDGWIRGYDPTLLVGFSLDEFCSKRKSILEKATLAYIDGKVLLSHRKIKGISGKRCYDNIYLIAVELTNETRERMHRHSLPREEHVL